MAHFAEIGPDNTVLRVLVIPDRHEKDAADFIFWKLKQGGVWMQTSYNTRGGKHLCGEKPLRKNFARPGFTYDHVRDAFIPPKPIDGDWVLDESTCLWFKLPEKIS